MSFAQAVQILGGGPDAGWVRRLNDVTGGLLLGATVTAPAVLGWFDAHAVFARLSEQFVTAAAQRLTGAHRLDRTDRLAAAHTVVVVAAYFEALADADLPFELARARISAEDQVRVVTGAAPAPHETLARSLLRASFAVPEPHGRRADYLEELHRAYEGVSRRLGAFLRGLALWDELTLGLETQVDTALAALPARAIGRYSRMFLDLAADCPEVDLWMRRQETAALLITADELHRLMLRIAGPAGDPAGLPGRVTRAYASVLDRPLAEAGDLAAGLIVPTLREAYLPLLFRVAEAGVGIQIGDERFWTDLPIRDDLHRFLVGYLTSPRARSAPIVVLGQPGAGKSVLTKVLAAELGSGGFLPVRVPFRDVDSALDLQGQIEQAVRAATGEQVSWPRLAESAAGRLPVILLDGFDELLQTTSITQSDYLLKVAAFQQREESVGRAAAVVVTTRTSVVDRAVAPMGTLALRLEPFDAERVSAWLATWHEANVRGMAARGLRPLPAEVALRFRMLAGQPLLLLLLALYDADENVLQGISDLAERDLYERLLTSFVRREIRKTEPGLGADELAHRVDRELRYLSVTAFAMLNRFAQWVLESDLEQDLTVVFGSGRASAGLLLGRFFFIHQARAVRKGEILHTYEFLHATFGEYLIARYTWALLRELPESEDLLSSLLSFGALVVRAPIVGFLTEMVDDLMPLERERLQERLIGLYRHSRNIVWVPGGYRPWDRPMTARYAAWTANLVLLSAVITPGIHFGLLAGPGVVTAGRRWHAQVLLWHSQLTDEEWDRTTQVFTIDQCRDAHGQREVGIRLGGEIASFDPNWFYNRPEGEQADFIDGMPPSLFRQRTLLQAGVNDSTLVYAVEPLLESPLAVTVRTFCGGLLPDAPSAAQALVRVWLLPYSGVDADNARTAYLACARIAAAAQDLGWAPHVRIAYAQLLLNAMAANEDLDSAVTREVEAITAGAIKPG